jgi:hypothetical protein
METDVAFVVVQVKVKDWPAATVAWLIVNVTVGAQDLSTVSDVVLLATFPPRSTASTVNTRVSAIVGVPVKRPPGWIASPNGGNWLAVCFT